MSETEISLQEFVEKFDKENEIQVSRDRWVIRCPDADRLKICSAEPIADPDENPSFQCNKPVAVQTKNGEAVPLLESTSDYCRHSQK